MAYRVTVGFTELVSFFRKVDGKIESLQKDLNAEGSSGMFEEIGELKSVQKDLEVRLDKIIDMFHHFMAEGDDNHLDVYAASPEGLTVVRATVQWFTKKQEEMEAWADHLLNLKTATASRKHASASPLRKARRKDSGIKLETINEDTAANFPGGGGKDKEIKVGSAGSDTGGSDIPNPKSSILTLKEASKGKISSSVSEIEEVPETSDKDPIIRQATVPVGILLSPRKRLADLLNLTELSDNDWKPVEDILGESAVLIIELSLLVVELYIQLRPREEEGMSVVLNFVECLNKIEEHNEVGKWILYVLKVADEEPGHLAITSGQPGISTAEEVHDLLLKFLAVISSLDSVYDFLNLPESLSSINEAVELLKVELKYIKTDITMIKDHMEACRVKMKYGFVAPLIIGIVNHIGMCFKHCFYRGNLR